MKLAALLVLGACWHDPSPATPYPPLPKARAPRTWVAWMGAPALDLSATIGLGQMDASVMLQRARATPPKPHLVLPKQLPSLGAGTVCGFHMYVGDDEVAWCVGRDDLGTLQFVRDDNADGDLSNDILHAFAHDGPAEWRLALGAQFIALVNTNTQISIVWLPSSTRTGLFELDGQPLTIHVSGQFGRFDTIRIDGHVLDHGTLDLGALRVKAGVPADGSRVTFTEVVR